MKTVTVRIGARGRPGEAGASTWTDITGKPSTFPPSSHTHTQSEVTGLVAALAGKASTSHSHIIGDVSGLQAALDSKAAASHTHAQSDVTGLASTLAAKADLVDGMVPTNQIPAIAITEFLGSVASQSAMLALTGQRGDWCNRSDVSKAFVLVAEPASTLSNWAAIDYPAAPVLSVNGQAGTVVLGKSDVGLGNVPNTDATSRANHTGTQAIASVDGLQTALDSKAGLNSPALTGTPTSTTPVVADDSTRIATSAFVHDAAGAMTLQQRVIPCGTHTEHSNDNGQSNGSDTTTTSRTRVYITCDCTDAQVLLTNIWGSTSPAANGFNVTVKAAIEINSVVYPLFIRGSRTAVLAAGAAVLTDPFAYRFTAGDAVFLRINATVSSGDKWPRWAFFSNGVDQFQTGSDMVDSGTLTGTNGYSYRASGFYARPTTANQAAVAVIGDSISAGSGGNTWMNGFIQRAFGGDYGKSVPHAFAGASGETIANFIDQTKTIYRLGILRGCTSALVELGINDVGNSRTSSQIQNDLLTLYARLRSLGIRRIYQTTLTPRTTSTDSWATVNNQTPHANDAARVTVNNWIRANTAGIEGYFEIADIVESARDSGLWKASYTADGLHPNDATHTLMAAGITTSGLLQLP